MAMSPDPADPTTEGFAIFSGLISGFLCVATIIVLVLATIGSRSIVYGSISVSKADPEVFDRYSKIVVSITGVIAVLLSCWGVFVGG